ncbi:hypothetical protein A5707_07575 [Mycobacterium kyorinense]|uniref:Uncharacterized protein n=1 Tax=Mycobacterium kyorinense TaxID=487514 RepID=A0A1A2YT43_9MYCO|nr:hypothetical protein [Mycobacterium kyorinense]OBI41414.1 hypothetical protein A5707_07575 [Mycobacterium kyorinense]
MEQFAERVIASWGDGTCDDDLLASIETLYQARLRFPPSWPEHRRQDFIARHADLAASELGGLFDDLIDTVINDHGLQHGVMPHSEDAAQLVHAARRDALDDFLMRIDDDMVNEIAVAAAQDPGRGHGSMTACGPGQRPATITTCRRRPRHSSRP